MGSTHGFHGPFNRGCNPFVASLSRTLNDLASFIDRRNIVTLAPPTDAPSRAEEPFQAGAMGGMQSSLPKLRKEFWLLLSLHCSLTRSLDKARKADR